MLPSQWCGVGGGLSWVEENSVTNMTTLSLHRVACSKAELAWVDSEGKGDLTGSQWDRELFLISGAVFNATRCVCTSRPSTLWPGGTPFSSDANGKVEDANNGDEVGKQWHQREERMTLSCPLWATAGLWRKRGCLQVALALFKRKGSMGAVG